MGGAIKSPHHIDMVIEQGYSCTWKKAERSLLLNGGWIPERNMVADGQLNPQVNPLVGVEMRRKKTQNSSHLYFH